MVRPRIKGCEGVGSGKRTLEELRELAEKYKKTDYEFWMDLAMTTSGTRLGENFHVFKPLDPE